MKKKSPQERLFLLTKKKNEKVLTLQKAESEKSYLVKKIERLSNKKCSEMDVLQIRLQKKMRSIRHLTCDINKMTEQISELQSTINKS